MKFKKQVMIESIVGVFTFAALGALFILTVVLSRESLFRAASPVEIVFENVMGLRVGDAVSSRGVVIGKVKQMALEADGVHVMVMLDAPLQLREDYRVEVLSSSVLGGRYLNISQGSSAAPAIETPSPLQGSESSDLIDSATRAVEDIRVALNDGVLDDLKATMHNIRSITDRLGTGEGTLARLLNEGAVYEDVQQITANLKDVSIALAQGEGTLGKLMMDDSIFSDVQVMAANFKDISGRLAQGEGTVGKLLMADDAVYDDLAASIANIRRFTDGMANGEGTIGKLMSDEEVYLELKSLLREGRAAIDDIRETSPISTFTSIFFGAF